MLRRLLRRLFRRHDREWLDSDGYHFRGAANLRGSVGCAHYTTGTQVITGAATSFTTELTVNQVISIPGTATEIGTVDAIVDNTHLTIGGDEREV